MNAGDWAGIAKELGKIGLPILGTAIGGPAGGAIGGLVASILGGGEGASPEQLATALQGATPEQVQKLKELETQITSKKLDVIMSEQKAQADINLEESKSSSKFIAGWRPGLGWVGVISYACYFIPQAVLGAIMWCIQAWHVVMAGTGTLPPYPSMDMASLSALVLGMLGIGGLRSLDKYNGADTKKFAAIFKKG